MKQLDYVPTPHDLYSGLIGKSVVVYTTSTTFESILNGVSTFFIEFKSSHSSRYTYVFKEHIVAISCEQESQLDNANR